jgi:hypothetical protein
MKHALVVNNQKIPRTPVDGHDGAAPQFVDHDASTATGILRYGNHTGFIEPQTQSVAATKCDGT